MSAELSSRLQSIRSRVGAASHSHQRNSRDITIIAVTKTFPIEVVTDALSSGLVHIGENRVQEALTKVEAVRPGGIFHLIGHLQSNKVKKAVEIFDWIQTIDDIEIATEISRRASEAGRSIQVLVEVNSSGEAQKHGIRPEETIELVHAVSELPNLALRGLMTVGPLTEDEHKIQRAFDLTRTLFEQSQREIGSTVDTLSMGMSDDYELAIRHGSTMIRLGSVLFGDRA